MYARARYADDLAERQLLKRVQRGQNAANVVESTDDRRSIDIFAEPGAPVVAVNDGVIKKIGRNRRLGRFVVLQDVYGNRYTYAHLGSVSREYPVPKRDAEHPDRSARAAKANGDAHDPKPAAPASAGRQLDASDRDSQQASAPVRERLFAHPAMEGAREFGGLEQLLDAKARRDGTHEVYKNYFSRPFGLDPSKVTLRRLEGRVARHRRHHHRPHRPHRAGHGGARRLLDPPGRQGRAEDRSQADPGRLEAARGHRDLPRLRPQRAAWRGFHRTGPPAAEDGPREARPGRRADRHLRVRPRRHPLGTDRPARAGHARLPGRVGPASDRHQPQVRPRLLHQLRQRLGAQLGQRGRHRGRQRHPDPGPPGARAASPSRPSGG